MGREVCLAPRVPGQIEAAHAVLLGISHTCKLLEPVACRGQIDVSADTSEMNYY
jgi:hypothetical protein